MNDGTPTQAGGLKDLAEVRFGKETLSDAEKLLLNNVTFGDWADCSKLNEEGNDPEEADKWGKARQIRAALVTWLCTDKRALQCIHPKGIQVHGADITDTLNLSFVNVPFQLTLHCCRLKDHIDLSRAEVSELDLQGSLVNGILAECVTVRHCVFLTNGFTANGEVRLLVATELFYGAAIDKESVFTRIDKIRIPRYRYLRTQSLNAGVIVHTYNTGCAGKLSAELCEAQIHDKPKSTGWLTGRHCYEIK
jgi:hypothetical protein